MNRPGPGPVASRRLRRSARLNVCGIRLGAPRACVLELLGPRPGPLRGQAGVSAGRGAMNRIGTNRSRTFTAVLVLAAASLAWPAVAVAQVTTIFEFTVPTLASAPTGITTGPDGNLWFTENNTDKIGVMSPGGMMITEFSLPPSSNIEGLTAGPDGNLWFTAYDANKIGRITPAGVSTSVTIPTANSGAEHITAGPDGNLWFTETVANKIGRITPAGVSTEFPVPTAGAFPEGITAGPDGNVCSPNSTATRSAASRRPGSSPSSRSPRRHPVPTALRRAPTATSGSPSKTAVRSVASSHRPR
jgi:streptogramin lyase